MRRYSVSVLLILAVMSIFWAYTVIDTLLREFSANVTFIDLGTLVIFGFLRAWQLG